MKKDDYKYFQIETTKEEGKTWLTTIDQIFAFSIMGDTVKIVDVLDESLLHQVKEADYIYYFTVDENIREVRAIGSIFDEEVVSSLINWGSNIHICNDIYLTACAGEGRIDLMEHILIDNPDLVAQKRFSPILCNAMYKATEKNQLGALRYLLSGRQDYYDLKWFLKSAKVHKSKKIEKYLKSIIKK